MHSVAILRPTAKHPNGAKKKIQIYFRVTRAERKKIKLNETRSMKKMKMSQTNNTNNRASNQICTAEDQNWIWRAKNIVEEYFLYRFLSRSRFGPERRRESPEARLRRKSPAGILVALCGPQWEFSLHLLSHCILLHASQLARFKNLDSFGLPVKIEPIDSVSQSLSASQQHRLTCLLTRRH